MSDTHKRFEDWEIVECEDCVHWWDSSCDGVPVGSQRTCNSFLGTRKVVIPAQMKVLEKSVKRLRISLALTMLTLLAHLLEHILGGA